MAAWCEAPRLSRTLAGVCAVTPNVVVVDDGSTDETAQIALTHPVWVIRHPFNCGQGAALQTGIDFALAQGARAIVTFDADGQHSADEIARLAAPILADECDVVLGSRFLGSTVGMPWARRAVLKLGVLFTRVFSGIRVTDTHNGLRAFSPLAAREIRITQNRMAHASEILDQISHRGLAYREVPVTIHYDAETLAKGQSGWNALRIVSQLFLSRLVP
jgi:glycosyltransferase involved in cell wall biosynthesis